MSARTSIVVGGSGAIGGAVCALLAERGDHVVVADLRGAGEVARNLPGAGHAAVDLDITDLEDVHRVLGPEGIHRGADAIVYAAGVNYTGPVSTTDWDAYDRLMAVNLRGAFHLGQAASLDLERAPRPLSLVFLSSVAGLHGEGGGSVYVSTKFGLIGFVQSLASEVARYGARANAVCPGNVDSPLLRQLAADVAGHDGVTAAEKLREFAGATAYNRLISLREVAEVCAFLAAPSSSGLSGQSVVVDGPPL
ncbi:SDR family NAD(P)-dependent oxidoreductase [uncultured Microbacterium sp.]|uniref:SDR family NAD(P)-dependent oxidoreductase n=1 Tax=uncultured Microbacterium sp. TaxID=191216 RepID=UPI0035CB083A